jgi:stress response protein YsnF
MNIEDPEHAPVGGDALAETASGAGEQAVSLIRSEEELDLGTRWVARERVRLVKRVITESVTATVELRREELHIERVDTDDSQSPVEPIEPAADSTSEPDRSSAGRGRGRAVDRMRPAVRDRLRAVQRRVGGRLLGTPFAEEDTEIILLAEQAVVTKRVVPRERVRLRKTIVTDRHAVRDTVRRERVELIDETSRRERRTTAQ